MLELINKFNMLYSQDINIIKVAALKKKTYLVFIIK